MTIMPSNPEYDVIQNGWEKFIDLKKANPKLKLLMSIKSLFTSDFIQPAEQRKSFIDTIVGFVEEYKFDGVSIVWFGYWDEEEDKGTIYKFFEELRRSFEAAGHPEWEANIMMQIRRENIDYGQICRVADSISLIPVYDSNTDRTNLLSPLNNSTFNTTNVQDVSITHSVQKWLKNGCPPNKIILGVPFMGRTFTLDDPANNGLDAPFSDHGKPCPVTSTKAICAYFELCKKFNETEWTFKWDENGAAPYAFQDDQWVTYENAASIEKKAAFARTKGLGGVFGWELEYDDYRGICGEQYPLTKALWNAFHSKANP
ncbi:endochitinase-like [Anopheles coustani]|uniref:endochitinase-like n=1 Tax=Anopheles coustani TaxID=139045 RepID=UPI00265A8AFF|nr:endochitinase-like [Anopheles coustani]